MSQTAYVPNLPAVAPDAKNLIDGSGTIASGGSAQTAVAERLTRRFLLIHNPDASEDLWYNIGATAVASQPSIKLTPKSTDKFSGVDTPTGAVSVIATSTSHQFVVKEM